MARDMTMLKPFIIIFSRVKKKQRTIVSTYCTHDIFYWCTKSQYYRWMSRTPPLTLWYTFTQMNMLATYSMDYNLTGEKGCTQNTSHPFFIGPFSYFRSSLFLLLCFVLFCCCSVSLFVFFFVSFSPNAKFIWKNFPRRRCEMEKKVKKQAASWLFRSHSAN